VLVNTQKISTNLRKCAPKTPHNLWRKELGEQKGCERVREREREREREGMGLVACMRM
jgi:hypothetical protein